ncbi:2-oxoacid:acceptor oxidoreductase subunit alpha [Dactylosporangium sp. NBC_01737]|uniref:2-oxoacid:acceptor oxidoreductase subunit alpha n=1 Tax=Dactylosporangium sp. NBC_01737 TaxID=2975959 RepID=UPI002E12B28D|nr:2-oxoacid:acceptor oxidoreductase subunit alpha [Dactylosporangium sp. NBC_01737]
MTADGVAGVRELDRVVIRFAGDSGDGMQLTGDLFTADAARLGNDVSTLPNFPAEIRAPAGTLPGVSSFQLHFAAHDIATAGDAPDVLVAMNPAALRANTADLPPGAVIIVNTDEFTPRNLRRAGYAIDPLGDGSLDAFAVHAVPLTGLTTGALAGLAPARAVAERARNMFAFGLLSWMYARPHDAAVEALRRRFRRRPELAEVNVTAFEAGWSFGETTEAFAVRCSVRAAALPPGTYRTVTGNTALALGLAAAGVAAELPVLLGAYPITPASDILHQLAGFADLGVTVLQAEDEIAAACAALGASYGGALGVTATSGPGLALKSETISLAVALELPLVVVDVQRAGPSTGLPTKTEQADLAIALSGRHGEAPVAVVAARSPADCFDTAVEAARIALAYRTPVLLLSDGYLANGAEPWLVPDVEDLPDLRVTFATEPNGPDGRYLPYARDPLTLARAWAVPGTPGLEHRVGGLEKADGTGEISYDPANHDLMVRTRAARIEGIAVPDVAVEHDPLGDAGVLVLGWGSTYGPIRTAVLALRQRGLPVAQAHLRHLSPLPGNLEAVLRRYRRVLVPEMNLGQLAHLVRGRFAIDVLQYNQVRGLPFTAGELEVVLEEVIRDA